MADRARPQTATAGPPAARSVALHGDVAPLRTVGGGGLAGAAPAALTFRAQWHGGASAECVAAVEAAMARDAYISEIAEIADSYGYELKINMPTKEEARRKRLHEAAQVEGVGL